MSGELRRTERWDRTEWQLRDVSVVLADDSPLAWMGNGISYTHGPSALNARQARSLAAVLLHVADELDLRESTA